MMLPFDAYGVNWVTSTTDAIGWVTHAEMLTLGLCTSGSVTQTASANAFPWVAKERAERRFCVGTTDVVAFRRGMAFRRGVACATSEFAYWVEVFEVRRVELYRVELYFVELYFVELSRVEPSYQPDEERHAKRIEQREGCAFPRVL